MFLCGFAVWGSFGCDFAVEVSLVNMAACWRSVVSAVDACWITSLFTSWLCGLCGGGLAVASVEGCCCLVRFLVCRWEHSILDRAGKIMLGAHNVHVEGL